MAGLRPGTLRRSPAQRARRHTRDRRRADQPHLDRRPARRTRTQSRRPRLAWTSWRHPDLPWDSTQLWVADLDGARLDEPCLVAGGDNESIAQPRWSPNGELYFVSDRSGWWNLYRWHAGQVEPVAISDTEMAPAPWELGYSSYAFLDDGQIAILLQRGGRTELVLHRPGSGTLRPQRLPYTSIKPFLATDGHQLALIGSTAHRTPAVAIFDPAIGDLRELVGGRQVADERFVSLAQPFDYPPRDGDTAHGLYFSPTNPDVQRPDAAPPLIVRPHAGPATNAPVRLDPTVQFFTSRGFAVADIDYPGSTGYGRTYRRKLDGHWGHLDVNDCADATRHLIARGTADPSHVMISGASAGGYTALMAAATTRDFAAVTARSAIIDPAHWQRTTGELQRHHADALLDAPSPGTSHSIIGLANHIVAPVLLIHGDRDEIAPFDDALKLARALDDRGAPARLLPLGGEGHTLQASPFVQQALDAALAHYLHALGQSRH
jgi:dipeptidyl aminopeptidase/acylaminoacyl peptidase